MLLQLKKYRSLFLSLLALGLTLPVAAQKLQKSKALQRLEQERKQLLRNIASSDKKLQQLRSQTNAQEQTLQAVRQQVDQRRQVVAVLGSEVSGLQARIDTLSANIGHLRRREGALLQRYRTALQRLQRLDTHMDPVLFVLSARNPSQARERQRFLARYTQAVKDASTSLRQTRTQIEHTKREVGRTHSEKEQLLALRESEKAKLEQDEAQKSAEVKQLKGQQQSLAKDLNRLRLRADQLDKKIQQQVEAEILAAQKRAEEQQRRAEAARKRREEARRKREEARRAYEAKLAKQREEAQRAKSRGEKVKVTPPPPPPPPPATESEEARDDESTTQTERRAATPGGYAMDASERALASSFAQNKGRLPAPIRGAYSILRTFGLQQHSEHNRVKVNSSGVDYGVSGDSRAYAVFSGVVSRVFVIPGYGTAIILRHGNYLTVYANLSSVSVSTGAKVSTGQPLGTIAAAPDGSAGRLLHFQLWHERTKLNPLSWVRR